jgi:hypothetical protein
MLPNVLDYDGAMVRYEDPVNLALLDMTPGSHGGKDGLQGDFLDAVLKSAWTDPFTGTRLEVVSRDASGLALRVHYDPARAPRADERATRWRPIALQAMPALTPTNLGVSVWAREVALAFFESRHAGSPIGGLPVELELTRPDGTKITRVLRTEQSGGAFFSMPLRPSDPRGKYVARVRVPSDKAAAASVEFQVP